MTTSTQNHDKLWEKLGWLALTDKDIIQRRDITTLLRFQEGKCNPLYLFWDLYKSEWVDGEGNTHTESSLPKEHEKLILALLEDIYERHRVPYEPDSNDQDIKDFLECLNEDDPVEEVIYESYEEREEVYIEEDDEGIEQEYTFTWNEGVNPQLNPEYDPHRYALPSKLNDLLVFIHVAAACAFRVKRTDGYSDVVRDCLNEVERTIERLKRNGLDMEEDIQHTMAIFQSAYAISAIAFVELGRISKVGGEYEKALRYFAMADEYYLSMSYPVNFDDDWPFEAALWAGYPIDGVSMPYLEDRVVENRFEYLRTGLSVSLKEMVDVFELIKSDTNLIRDWGQVAQDCRTLGNSVFFRFGEYEDAYEDYEEDFLWDSAREYNSEGRILVNVEDDDTQTWDSYWSVARGWVSAQLSPSEYRKMRGEDERYAAERRLKTYFFGSNWSYLPGRTQERLINADILFNSRQRVALEALLNDLRIATEAMCFQNIWKPLTQVKRGSTEILGFMKVKTELAERHPPRYPGISEYIQICRGNGYSEFLRSLEIGNDDIRFLSKTLPNKMSQLRSERNLAEHEIGSLRPRDAIESFYHGFLGIGQAGVLPELARIGRKLRQSLR